MAKQAAEKYYIEQAREYADQLSDLAGELGTGIEVGEDAIDGHDFTDEGYYIRAWIYVSHEAARERRNRERLQQENQRSDPQVPG